MLVAWEDRFRSSEALALGGLLASVVDADLLLAHVFPTGVEGSSADAVLEGEDCEEVDRRVDAVLAEAGELLGPAHPGAKCVAVPALTVLGGLHQLAAEERALFLAISAADGEALGKLAAGDPDLAPFPGPPCPLAVAPRGYSAPAGGLDSIGVGFDGGEESWRALRAAGDLAIRADARLRVIAAVEAPSLSDPLIPSPQFRERGMRRRQIERRRALDAALASLRGSLPATALLRDGLPAAELVEATRYLDLLVVGSSRHGPLGRASLGSTTMQMVERSRCPLVILARRAEWPS